MCIYILHWMSYNVNVYGSSQFHSFLFHTSIYIRSLCAYLPSLRDKSVIYSISLLYSMHYIRLNVFYSYVYSNSIKLPSSDDDNHNNNTNSSHGDTTIGTCLIIPLSPRSLYITTYLTLYRLMFTIVMSFMLI
jgi:hypothetical protein